MITALIIGTFFFAAGLMLLLIEASLPQKRRSQVAHFVLGLSILIGATMLALGSFEAGYKNGQVNAINGKIEYQQVPQDSVWVKSNKINS